MVVVVVPFVVVVVLSTGAAAGIRIVELLLPVSTTTFCPCPWFLKRKASLKRWGGASSALGRLSGRFGRFRA
jgi:hypothetical protein